MNSIEIYIQLQLPSIYFLCYRFYQFMPSLMESDKFNWLKYILFIRNRVSLSHPSSEKKVQKNHVYLFTFTESTLYSFLWSTWRKIESTNSKRCKIWTSQLTRNLNNIIIKGSGWYGPPMSYRFWSIEHHSSTSIEDTVWAQEPFTPGEES